MSNFLTHFAKKSSETGQTPAALRRETFQNEVAAFRTATGKPETRSIPCRCAVTGQGFSIVFERQSPAHRFQIARIERENAAGDRPNGFSGLFSRPPQQKSYDAGEFDWAGYVCPHCGNGSGTVHCGQCRETVCAGRVRALPDGSKAFACHDGCGSTGTIEPSSHVHGGAAESRAAMGNWPLLPGRPPMKLLPRRSPQRLLPRPRRQ
jgi:hypothetical protein